MLAYIAILEVTNNVDVRNVGLILYNVENCLYAYLSHRLHHQRSVCYVVRLIPDCVQLRCHMFA